MIQRPPRSTLSPYTALFRATPASGGQRPDKPLQEAPETILAGLRGAPRSEETRLNSSHPEISRMPAFFCNDPATAEIYTLPLHGALPSYASQRRATTRQTAPGGP